MPWPKCMRGFMTAIWNWFKLQSSSTKPQFNRSRLDASHALTESVFRITESQCAAVVLLLPNAVQPDRGPTCAKNECSACAVYSSTALL